MQLQSADDMTQVLQQVRVLQICPKYQQSEKWTANNERGPEDVVVSIQLPGDAQQDRRQYRTSQVHVQTLAPVIVESAATTGPDDTSDEEQKNKMSQSKKRLRNRFDGDNILTIAQF